MPRDVPSQDQWYTPMKQPATLYGSGTPGNLSGPPGGFITRRSALDPEHMIQTLRSTVAEIDPLLALEEVRPVTEAVSAIEAPRHFNTDLISAFAASALLLAIAGIYTVMAFSVSQRTQEVAIRMALGAQRAGIARLVLVSGAKLALIGCGLGVLGSLGVSRRVRSFRIHRDLEVLEDYPRSEEGPVNAVNGERGGLDSRGIEAQNHREKFRKR